MVEAGLGRDEFELVWNQSVEQFAQQVASDKVFFAALIKDLNLKLE